MAVRILVDCENLSGRTHAREWAGVGAPLELFGSAGQVALWEEALCAAGTGAAAVHRVERVGRNAADALVAYHATRRAPSDRLIVVSGDADLRMLTAHLVARGARAVWKQRPQGIEAFMQDPQPIAYRPAPFDRRPAALVAGWQASVPLVAAWEACGYRTELLATRDHARTWRAAIARVAGEAEPGTDLVFGEGTPMRAGRGDLVMASRCAELRDLSDLRIAGFTAGMSVVHRMIQIEGVPIVRCAIPPGTELHARWEEVRASDRRLSLVLEACAGALHAPDGPSLGKVGDLLAREKIAFSGGLRAAVERAGLAVDARDRIPEIAGLLLSGPAAHLRARLDDLCIRPAGERSPAAPPSQRRTEIR